MIGRDHDEPGEHQRGRIAPSIELKNAAESVRAAPPRFAIGKPSRIVACEAALPGIPIRSS